MFARNVSFRLKAASLPNFVLAFEKEVLPLLRKQAGFREEILLGGEGSTQVNAISLWETKEQADAYEIVIYPGILQDLDRFFEAAPKVRVTPVISSTITQSTVATTTAASCLSWAQRVKQQPAS